MSTAKLVSMLCPNCEARLDVDESLEKAFCQYCGTQFIVARPLSKQYSNNTTLHYDDHSITNKTMVHQNTSTSVRIGKKGAVESVVDYIENKKRMEEEAERRQRENIKKAFINNWQLILSIIMGITATSSVLDFFKLQGIIPFLICCVIMTSLFLILLSAITGKVNSYRQSDNKMQLAKDDFEKTKNVTMKTAAFVNRNWKILLPITAIALLAFIIMNTVR